jgi:hypothetical protein
MQRALRSLSVLLALHLVSPTAAQPQALTTTFTSNNGGSTGWVVMFDATVLNPAGLRIVALDVNCSSGAALPVNVKVFTTPSTYVGVERNAGAWTEVSSGNAVSAARNTPTFVDMADFDLPQGTLGVAVQVNGSGVAYTNGTGSNQMYADTNLSLQLGAALASQFQSTGLLFTPRVWNGTIYYAARGNATYGVFGAGCSGSNGTPTLAPAMGSLPKIGQTLTLEVGNGPLPNALAVVALGFSKTTAFGLPLPIDLTAIGMPGCTLLIEPFLNTGVGLVNGTGTYTLPIPNRMPLFGLALHHQAFVFDPPANQTGLTLSNAGEGVIGN